MKKVCKLEGLGCAHCAVKMEDAIRKLNGVSSASINFMTQKLTIEADNGEFGEIISKAAKICKRIEPACKIIL